MNNSVEALIPFNKGHRVLLKLHAYLGWWWWRLGGWGRGLVPVWDKRGLCFVALLQGGPVSPGFLLRNFWKFGI